MSGESPDVVLYDFDGYALAVRDGSPIPVFTPALLHAGSDGTNSRYLLVDSSGRQIMVGAGTAGSSVGGVITIQGDPSGTPVPITGAISATNPSVGTNDTSAPGSSTQIGGTDGTNLRALRAFDLDSGGGQQWILGVGLRKSSGGGSVEFGTSSDPIRTDPTGTTTQPVSGTVTANQGGSWTVSGTGNFTVVQPTASNLRAQLASESTIGNAITSTAVLMGGSDGTNLRPVFMDSSGRQIIIGAAANGAAVAGNPVLIGGSDGTNARTIRTATDGTVRVDPTGTTTQPISGTVTANAGSGTFTVSGTVTANVGTTGGLALDTTLAKLTIAQSTALGSNTQALVGGSVTTAAPSYTNGNINPLSLTTAGALRIDGSGVTQPISGTVTSNQGTAAALSGAWPVKVTDGTNTQPTGDVASRAIFHKNTDGTNTAAVKAASTAAAAADPSLVVALSPNSLLPQGPFANTTIANPNPYVIAGRTTSDGYIRSVLVDTNGQIVVTANNPASTTIELSYDDSVAVAGAQAGYYYNGVVYTVPSSYTFSAVQFNSSSADNRVTARVSKFINGGTYNLGTNVFTSGSSYTSPNFGSYLEVEVTTVIGGTNDVTLTATYTNQDGVGSRTATALVKKNTPVNYKVIFTLQAGDYGVLSVQNITRSTANTGILSVKIGLAFYLQTMNTASQNYILATGTQALIAKAGEFIELAWSSNAAATSERIVKTLGTLTPTI